MSIAYDTEARSLRWWENPGFVVTWDTGQGGQLATLPGVPEYRGDAGNFKRAVKGEKHHVLANIKYDAHVLRKSLGEEVTFKPGHKWDDIIIKSRLVYGQRRIGRHGLKQLSEDFVDPSAKDAEIAMKARHKELTGTSDMAHDETYYNVWKGFPEESEEYARKDAEYTLAMDGLLEKELDADPKVRRLYEDIERPLMEVLYRAEERGVHVDPQAVERLRSHYQTRDTAAREAVQRELGFIPQGEGSQEALSDALLKAGVPLTELNKDGSFATNKQVLDKHASHPAVEALFEFRRIQKFLSTYLDHLVGKDHIHPTFNQAEAWTGRMSGRDPNMQNLPKRTEVGKAAEDKMRSVFVPEPGMAFIVADFESIEVFTLAHFIGVREYKDLVLAGDPHAKTAAVIWPQYGDWTKFTKQTENRWLRDIAKQVTYTIVYGGGGRVIADTINKYMVDAGRFDMMVDEDQARAIRRKITDNIPGFRELTDTPFRGRQFPSGRIHQQLNASRVHDVTVDGEAREYGFVRTLMGRKQWIQMYPEDKAYVGLSGLIQGSAADIMKAAAINVFEALKPSGGLPLLFVHDELVCQVPLGQEKELVPVVVDAMREAASLVDPPISVEATTTRISYAHSD